jgi:pyrimidine deaminase RibD-like protein
MNEHPRDRRFLREAITLSRNAPASDTAYSVGCVIVDAGDRIIATGFSRERDAHSHAEQVAIEKALEERAILAGSTLYSSLEPCSIRASELPTCAARIIEVEIPRVVFAMREPDLFVDGEGAEVLANAGVEVVEMPELAPLVAEVNAHLLRDG